MTSLVLALLLAAGAARAATPAPGFTESDVLSGLTQPTAIAFLPDGRLLVTQLGGELLLYDGGAPKTLITIEVCTAAQAEMGLAGVAVHPNFPADRRIYLYRTKRGAGACDVAAPDRQNELICVELAGDRVDPGTLLVLRSGIRADTGRHNGGGLRVGPDRKLYLGVGDSGTGDPYEPPGTSTNPYAQDLSVLEGKVLRLDFDGTAASDNPFIGQAGKRGEIFAYGFRNPFRLGFDPVTHRLWVGDVGERTLEELDIVIAGGNYGWPRCEGTLPEGCAAPGDVPPAFTYPHEGTGLHGEAVIGGAFAEGGAFTSLAGAYFFADFGGTDAPGAIYYAVPTPTRDGLGTPVALVTDVEGPVDLVFGPDGALYYVAHIAGAVRRVAPVGAPAACASITACEAELAAALPDPAAGPGRAARRFASRLVGLEQKAVAALAQAMDSEGARRDRQYARARRALRRLIGVARRANKRARLGVPLAPIESAAASLLGLLPT